MKPNFSHFRTVEKTEKLLKKNKYEKDIHKWKNNGVGLRTSR
jgi:hypothetical protein